MTKRETYMRRIRPFIGSDLIKILTGIRRSGKSVMLDLIQEELVQSGVGHHQMSSLNFENMSNAHLCSAKTLHDEIIRRASGIEGKVYLFLMKYYVADHGIREEVFGGNMRDINLVLENIIYMELLRRGYTVTVGKVSDKEIDFVCENKGNKLYVQVAYLLASEDTIHREFDVFQEIHDNFPKYVVTMDEFDMSRDGMKHRNVRDFLLAEE